jgi:hypothetical protein
MGESVSEWLMVLSGVPLGSVLGPLLFVIYINDIADSLTNRCKLYADDTKLINIIRKKEDISIFQQDLQTLMEWSNKWLVKFNTEKCKVMHIGKKNVQHNYTFDVNNEIIMPKITEEKDLGVILTNDLNWKPHINSAISKAYRKLGMIKHCFKYKNERTTKLLFTALVRPHLEYAAVLWRPHEKQDIEKIERVQHKATKIHSLRGLTYEQRLKRLEMISIEDRHKRGDMIQMYKINKNIDKVLWQQPIEYLGEAGTRGHKQRIRRQLTKKSNSRYHFFKNRVTEEWNGLTKEIVESGSTNIFKNRYDKSKIPAVTV